MNTNVNEAVRAGLTRIFNYAPQIIGAVAIVIIGWIVAKILQAAVYRVLRRLRFDHALHTSPAGRYIVRVIESPGRFTSGVTFWVVFLVFISFAVSALNLQVLNYIMEGVYAYIPRVIIAVIIFLIASALSAGADAFVLRVLGRSPMSRIIAAIVPAVALSIASFMILDELQIAPQIVMITYAAIMGSLALGLALAFGLGGRDLARTLLDQAYTAGRGSVGTIQSGRNTRNAGRHAPEETS